MFHDGLQDLATVLFVSEEHTNPIGRAYFQPLIDRPAPQPSAPALRSTPDETFLQPRILAQEQNLLSVVRPDEMEREFVVA
jgi:hypothetical protein